MYIKSIVLDGFKSYAHRTEVNDFDPLFTAITGLNGSGKSNILDSICFLLGMTHLKKIRVNKLEELIYKAGDCGITKATVSITFDNSNPDQCPPGFEDVREVTISRQIIKGGKCKYMINGTTAINKKIEEFFCSVQMNVNNPHFLIMQGEITKVLNMKPFEILSKIEEAAGTTMYEDKRKQTLKLIDLKENKMKELNDLMREEITPRLEKLRAEREQYMEYNHISKELERMLQLYKAWELVSSKRQYDNALKATESEQKKIDEIKEDIKAHLAEIEANDRSIEEMTKKAEEEGNDNLQRAESELKAAEKQQAKASASIKSVSEEISNEVKKKKQLEKSLADDEKALVGKQSELSKVEAMFLKLKEADARDTEAFLFSQRRFEALSAGMEINEQGEAQTLLQQLMEARRELSEVDTEIKQGSMRLKFVENQLLEKQKRRLSNANDAAEHERAHAQAKGELGGLESALKGLHFKEDGLAAARASRRALEAEVRRLQEQLDDFQARRPYAQFTYRDPEANFKKSSVFGVVCRLFDVKDQKANLALETAAGGKLFNVVIDSEVTGQKLLAKGDLQYRTTFIPLNKIRGGKINDSVVQIAQELAGKENVQPALALINYDKRLQTVMEYVFGNVLICKNIDIATDLAFHNRIRKKCVTLEGDVIDPAGTLAGGSAPKGGSFLLQLSQIKQLEADLTVKQQELDETDARISHLSAKENQFLGLKRQIEMKQHELGLIAQTLQQTSVYRHKEEVENLKQEIEDLQSKIEQCKEKERGLREKVKDLERKVKSSKGNKEQQLEEAEKEMHRLKAKSEQSRKEWGKKEQQYEVATLEIEELKKSLETTKEQILAAEEAIAALGDKKSEMIRDSEEVNAKVERLQGEYRKEKGLIADKSKDIQRKVKRKEELQGQVTRLEVKLKENSHTLKQLQEDCKGIKARLGDIERKAKGASLQEAEGFSEDDGRDLEKKIRRLQEKKHVLGRTMNAKAQTLFEQQEKEYHEVLKKLKIVEADRKKLIETIDDCDRQKRQVVLKACAQVSKDLGSIFSSLLPGANAKLEPPTGQTLLEGVEIKISLGDVWKESLTELSGGQRSLAALSFILAMLLFNPAPLYILDEVDAALDMAHTQNIGNMLKTHFKKSQFIVVSLKDGMFDKANVLFKTQFVDGISVVNRTCNVSQKK